jgi:hypothetical protein
MIESAIDHRIPANRIRHRRQITYSIRREIRLSEMPEFTRHRELPFLSQGRWQPAPGGAQRAITDALQTEIAYPLAPES